MADLDVYVDQVLDEQDQVLLREASACLAADAHRAAYIIIWLAVAESLRRKFVEASQRDHQAGQIVGQIQGRENQQKAVDALLLERAKDYGFITDAEQTRLRHLYENRNVFAHPYEEHPSAQLVEAAADEAVSIVLGRPAALREGYLSQQTTRLTQDRSFLRDDQQKVEDYARLVHGRSAADLRIWFVRKLVDALDAIFVDPSQDVLQRRGTWFLRAFLLADPEILQTWEAIDDLPDHPHVLPRTLAEPQVFADLSAHAKDIVVQRLIYDAADRPELLQLLVALEEAGTLEDHQMNELADKIASLPLSRLMISGLPFRVYWQRSLEGLRVHNWDTQNQAIGPIENAGPKGVAELDDDQQIELGRNVMQAAEGNAWGAINLLDAIGADSQGWPVQFVRGIALEPFASENGELRLKKRQLGRALTALASVPEPERDNIVDEIVVTLRAGSPRNPFFFRHDRDETVERLRDLAAAAGLQRVDEIASAVEAVEAPEDDV